MKILVTGASGLVGSRFVELSKFKESLICPRKEELDITNPNLVLPSADVVINFAAYTNVGEGENQRNDKNGLCWKINVDGVSNLLQASKDAFFIQISTDMVFSGEAGPYSEDNLPETDPNKVTWYGFTKGEGERSCKDHTILRLIYPVRAKFDKKLDYLRKPLSLFDQGKLYPMFTDQQVSFTFIDEICLALDKIIEKRTEGIFHASSSDLTTPFELGNYLLEKTRGVKNAVKEGFLPLNSIRYPKLGGLKVEKTEKELGIKFSSWREIIDKLVEQGI
ncbi:MAG: sugar nucleotide-binding protein [Patescibacteria group bacterium]